MTPLHPSTSFSGPRGPVVLLIMDGIGIGRHPEGDVVRQANDTPFGLAAAIWTRDVTRAHDFASRVRAGTVWVNCIGTFDVGAPFGGFKYSGHGREMGRVGIEEYTELKTVWVNLGER